MSLKYKWSTKISQTSREWFTWRFKAIFILNFVNGNTNLKCMSFFIICCIFHDNEGFVDSLFQI